MRLCKKMGEKKIKEGALARCSPQHVLTHVDEGNVAYILRAHICSDWRLLGFQGNQLPALFRLFMVHSFQAGILSLQAVYECRCQQPPLPRGEKLGGGRRTPLLGLDMQVWEPSREEESERWQAGMQRKFLKPTVLFQPFSRRISFHFRLPQVPAVCSSSHEAAVLPFQVQRTYTGGILRASARLSWARPHFVDTVTHLGGSSCKVVGRAGGRIGSLFVWPFPFFLPLQYVQSSSFISLGCCHLPCRQRSCFFPWSNKGES